MKYYKIHFLEIIFFLAEWYRIAKCLTIMIYASSKIKGLSQK